MRIAAWNVNSVKARLPHLLQFLKEDAPDVVLLQELKCVDDAFPRLEVEDAGYNIATHGEKTYNGVAILSKFPIDDVLRGLPGEESDTQARYIEALTGGFRVASVYVPNGQTVDSDKYAYKLRFLARLRAHLQTLLGYEERVVVGGDYNIAPYDVDVHNPAEWANTVLCHPLVRQHFRSMLNDGWVDAHRTLATSPGFTWWDYRAGAYAQDNGLRIDHLLLSPLAAEALKTCRVARNLRELERASDHAPVVGEFK